MSRWSLPLLLSCLPYLFLVGCGRDKGPKVSPREVVLERQVEGLETLVASARGGDLMRFDGVIVTLDEGLVQELLESATPYERIVGDRYRIVVQSARVRFRDGFGLVELGGRASLAGRDESDVFAEVRVLGGLEVVGLDPQSGVLRARVNVIGFEVPQVGVLGLSAPLKRLVEGLAEERVEEFNVLASNLEIPVAVEPRIVIPAIDEEEVLIQVAQVPLRVAVQDVRIAAGKLWVSIAVEVKPEGSAPQADSTAPPGTARGATPEAAPGPRAQRAPGTAPLATVLIVPQEAGSVADRAQATPPAAPSPRAGDDVYDPARPDSADTPRMTELRRRYETLRDSLTTYTSGDSLLGSIAADSGDVAVGIRPQLVDRLLEAAAQRYLDRVELRLQLDERVQESEEVKVKVAFATVTAGRWNLNVTIHRVNGILSAGVPELEVADANRLRITVPVSLESGSGNATIRFTWDAKGIAGAACEDFTRELPVDGTVVPRDYEVVGDLVLAAEGQRIVARPEFEKQRVRISVTPSPATWGKVRSTLSGLDTFGKCGIGMEFMSSDKIVKLLNGLVSRGFNVTLPTKIVPTLELPAGVTEAVDVEDRRVRIVARPNVLRITPQALWYSARVDAALEAAPREAVGPAAERRPSG